jgi:hypothetical protein
MYSVLSYYISKLLGEFPVIFVSFALLFIIVYPSCDLDYTVSSKYYYYGKKYKIIIDKYIK